jgi:hypothetical protein
MFKTVQISLFAIALCIGGMLNAQDILLEEKFDDSTLGVFSAYSVLGDGQVWEPRDFDDRFFAQMNGFDGGIVTNEDWLISPALDMDVYEDEVLAFENANNFNGPDLELLVSTDYDGTSDPNTATWTDLSQNVTWSSGNFEYVDSGEIDLSSFSGTGYIAFKYVSNVSVEGKLWQVDSIVVSASVLSNVNEAAKAERMITTPVVNGNQLTFEVLAGQKEMVFAIYHTNGQLVQLYNNRASLGTVRIPVAELAGGMYVLQVKSEQNLQAYKFVKK